MKWKITTGPGHHFITLDAMFAQKLNFWILTRKVIAFDFSIPQVIKNPKTVPSLPTFKRHTTKIWTPPPLAIPVLWVSHGELKSQLSKENSCASGYFTLSFTEWMNSLHSFQEKRICNVLLGWERVSVVHLCQVNFQRELQLQYLQRNICKKFSM